MKTNIRILRKVLTHINCGDIGLSLLWGCFPTSRGWGTGNFYEPHFPIGGRNQVPGLSQFHCEIGVLILLVDISRAVAEHSAVKVALRRLIV